MANPIRYEMKGLRELGETLSKLDDDIQKKVSRAATNAGAQVIKKLAVQKAPVALTDYVISDGRGAKPIVVPRGNLPKKISVKFLGKKSTLTSEHIVFIKGKRKDGYANRVGILQEFGTVKMPPHPFVRPAFDEGKEEAAEAIRKRLEVRIKAANKP